MHTPLCWGISKSKIVLQVKRRIITYHHSDGEQMFGASLHTILIRTSVSQDSFTPPVPSGIHPELFQRNVFASISLDSLKGAIYDIISLLD